MEFLMSFVLGLGLAAAAGFRVFVPLLLVSLAANFGQLELSGSFGWLGTPAAAVTLGFATLIEIGAYFIPWLDHLLDTIAVPASVVCGTLLMALILFDLDPLLKWSVAIIAGGGTAGVIQGATSGVRIGSTATTGGAGNPLVSGAETTSAFVLGILALVLPWLAALLVVILVVFLLRRAIRARRAMA